MTMHHEQKFMQEIKTLDRTGVKNMLSDEFIDKMQALGQAEAISLVEEHRRYMELIENAFEQLMRDYMASKVSERTYLGIVEMLEVPLYDPITFDQLEELKWRYFCVVERTLRPKSRPSDWSNQWQ